MLCAIEKCYRHTYITSYKCSSEEKTLRDTNDTREFPLDDDYNAKNWRETQWLHFPHPANVTTLQRTNALHHQGGHVQWSWEQLCEASIQFFAFRDDGWFLCQGGDLHPVPARPPTQGLLLPDTLAQRNTPAGVQKQKGLKALCFYSSPLQGNRETHVLRNLFLSGINISNEANLKAMLFPNECGNNSEFS